MHTVQTISFDLETSSKIPLDTMGAPRYVEDVSTRALMFAYHPVGLAERPRLWCEGDPIPDDFMHYVQSGARFSGWNVMSFDRPCYQRLLVERWRFPLISDDKWVDSMHSAAAANMPRSLAGAAKSIGVEFDEDKKDKARIKRITNANLTEIPYSVSDILNGRLSVTAKLLDDLQWLAARCVQDVEMEENVLLRLPVWPQMQPWLGMPYIDRKINDRGILVDIRLTEGLAKAASIEAINHNTSMNRLTGGKVPAATRVEALKHWLVDCGVALPPNDDDDDDDENTTEEDEKPSRKSPWKLRKNDIADLMARDNVPEECRLALGIRAEASKASARKFRTILARASSDGRLRWTMNLGGAQQTMRWASTGANLYNTVRDVYANPDEVAEACNLNVKTDHDTVVCTQNQWLRTAIEAGCSGDPEIIRGLYEKPTKDAQGRTQMAGVLTWISRMTRRTLAAPLGSVLLNGDFAQIEARITDWLAQQTDMLQAWAVGEDIYRATASGIFHIPKGELTKRQRQSGKVVKLACGFGGGINALLAMGYAYGLLMTEDEAAPIVKAYRDANAAVRAYWYATDDAAANAVRYPGHAFAVAPMDAVSYFMDPSGADCLCCRLPSGRWLRYWEPRLTQEYWKNDDGSRGKPKDRLSLSGIAIKGRAIFRRSLYHTILVENQVQAIAADMLGHGLDNADRNGIPVTLHVYDSLAAEVAEDRAAALMPVFEQCMLDQPSWAYGLPIAVDATADARFG